MSRKFNTKIIKIPTDRPSVRQKNFPRMPIMYLELLENKNKIKPEVVNKEYVPKPLPAGSPPSLPSIPEEEDKENYEERPQKSGRSDDRSGRSDDRSGRSDDRSGRSDDRSGRSDDRSGRSDYRSGRSDDRMRRSDDDESIRGDDDDPSPVKDENDGLSSRLREILSEERHSKRRDRPKSVSKSRDSENGDIVAPRLSEIGDGKYVPRKVSEDLDHSMKTLADEEDLKRELLFKFDLLKRSYKGSDIQEFTVHSDYKTMLRTYENTIRRVNIDSNIENYKGYLITGFYIVEFVLGYYLKFDMEDFTKQQILNMNKYEHLLVELGEKSYVPTGAQWPVEIRLLFMIIIQAAIFIVTKMVMKKIGGNFMGMMSSVATSQPQVARPRMRGPDINLSDD